MLLIQFQSRRNRLTRRAQRPTKRSYRTRVASPLPIIPTQKASPTPCRTQSRRRNRAPIIPIRKTGESIYMSCSTRHLNRHLIGCHLINRGCPSRMADFDSVGSGRPFLTVGIHLDCLLSGKEFPIVICVDFVHS